MPKEECAGHEDGQLRRYAVSQLHDREVTRLAMVVVLVEALVQLLDTGPVIVAAGAVNVRAVGHGLEALGADVRVQAAEIDAYQRGAGR